MLNLPGGVVATRERDRAGGDGDENAAQGPVVAAAAGRGQRPAVSLSGQGKSGQPPPASGFMHWLLQPGWPQG